MIVEHDPRRRESYGEAPSQAGRPHGYALRRFLGGSPAAVFVRLLFLSVLVGATRRCSA